MTQLCTPLIHYSFCASFCLPAWSRVKALVTSLWESLFILLDASVPISPSPSICCSVLFSEEPSAVIWSLPRHAHVLVSVSVSLRDWEYGVCKLLCLHALCPFAFPAAFRSGLSHLLSHRGDHRQKFYWGHKEILIPVYKNMSDAMRKHPEVDVLINFASLRSAYDSTVETMNYPQVSAGSRRSPNEEG